MFGSVRLREEGEMRKGSRSETMVFYVLGHRIHLDDGFSMSSGNSMLSRTVTTHVL